MRLSCRWGKMQGKALHQMLLGPYPLVALAAEGRYSLRRMRRIPPRSGLACGHARAERICRDQGASQSLQSWSITPSLILTLQLPFTVDG